MKVIIGTIKVQFSPPILGVAALLCSFSVNVSGCA